ncbi:MAP kinase kinase [Venturia nashicola]|uniref:MAP kinase kinase n=1 Tax=Venturia nashicola TaxID=86259 RepID=A0A4Z1P4U3_9PEZI|nr:MAP kinase kinase [Venturia nashicola]TLD36518.1 MAP kinase kinase [Venturia nashicola]
MVINLLPASAAAFAPRSAPTIVLSSKVEPWLTQTLKRINRIKRPLNSVPQHYRCLTETLSGPDAIWTLCSVMLPKKPDSELIKDSNPLVEAMFNYQFIHIEAYVVHVDMVSQHEVAFKLTPETIEDLIKYHKEIYSVDVSASTWTWAEKEVQLKKLQEEFVQAINRFVFRTGMRALEGLEEDGAGELLDGRSEDVKNAILQLFHPLLPPPPRIVDVVRPAPLLPSSTGAGNWWIPSQSMAPQPPVDAWRVLSSTPSPTAASCSDETPAFWATMDNVQQLPSPTPSFSQPYCSSGEYYTPPQTTASLAMPCSMPYTTASPFSTASLSLPLPMPLANCGSSAASDFGGFAWSYNNFAPQYASVL